jgi:hypothetical protein
MARTERGAWENIKVNIKTSVTQSLGLHKLSSINHALMMNV